jgi:hypothetical protein
MVFVWSQVAAADTIAASLYEEGVALLKEKKFEEACAKLDASFKREPLSGTLMVLAQCHELRDMTATAWDEYTRAAGLAATEGRKEYEQRAKELADNLQPKLCRVQVTLAPAAQREGLVVTLAGAPVDAAALGTAHPLDPGEYEVGASAPGHEPWSTKIPQPERPAPSGGVPAWAWVVGAAGLVMGGVAVGFLVDDLAAISELRDRCEPDPNGGENDYLCDAGYDVEADNARKNRSGALALGFGIGAAVALTASVVGIAIGAGDSSDSARVDIVPLASPGGAGVAVAGRF